MSTAEKIEKLIKQFFETQKSSAVMPFEKDEQIINDALAAFEKHKTQSAHLQPSVWRIIMKSRITKFAVAAIIIVAAVLSIGIFDRTVPTALGIEQIIEAYNNIHYLHVKEYRKDHPDSNGEPWEFWIKSNEQGGIEKARYYLPETEDGPKLITWTPEKAEIWFKKKNSHLIFQSKKIEKWMKTLIEQSQPKLVMENFLEKQKIGVIDINTTTPSNKQEPTVIVVTYRNIQKKEIYYINQATNLITSIELYDDGNSEPFSTREFYEYNVRIDEKMFTLKDEVPKDVTVVDQLSQLIGIPQGSMTDEQAAAETVRQFFQALIDKNYKKAGLIYSGISEEKAKERFGRLNVIAIISVDNPVSFPQCGEHSFSVGCQIELVDESGKNIVHKFGSVKARCGDDEMHPDRWIIHGGI
ncbi:MAG: hypothetical protein LLF92_01745 [Planctomycetaceae bacterium]|nr:hypothetical protein [Planctomycetaceae bacterium]